MAKVIKIAFKQDVLSRHILVFSICLIELDSCLSNNSLFDIPAEIS